MQTLEQAVREVLGRHQRGAMNESNTKVLLVEPVLEALGWDTKDLDCVTREHKVYDGSFLDYALLIAGKPVLFVEAKAWGGTITDPKWTAQTVNYANNAGVVWCVLTDGVVYRVYKTNEPVDMARKLVFEIDLREGTDDQKGAVVFQRLRLLSQAALAGGQLDALGSRLFDEARVRRALENLFREAPNRFVSLIRDQLPDGERQLSPADIRTMLGRIGKGLLPTDEVTPAMTAATATASTPPRSDKDKARPGPVRGKTFTYEEHFGDKPQVIVDLYTQLHERIVGLSSDIERLFRKQYVGYRIGKKVFCSVIPQKQRLRLILNIDPALVADHPLGRDVTGVGHWGVGNTEMTLDSEDSLAEVLHWVGEAAKEAIPG